MATRKSPSRVKPKKVAPDFEPLEDIFDKAKKVMLMKLDANIEVSKRIDNLMSVRDTAYRFWGDELDSKFIVGERMKYFKKLQDITTNTYELLKKATEEFDLEEFKKGDMKDYFEHIIPDVEAVEDEEDLIKGMIIYQCVHPYGSQMNSIHSMIQDEIEKRKIYEVEV